MRKSMLLAGALVLALAAVLLPACNHEARSGGEMSRGEQGGGDQAGGEQAGAPLRDINDVMADHVDSLMATEGVTGVAISETPGGTPCIMILVRELTEQMRRALPERIEGHPTCLFESGEIRPLGGGE